MQVVDVRWHLHVVITKVSMQLLMAMVESQLTEDKTETQLAVINLGIQSV